MGNPKRHRTERERRIMLIKMGQKQLALDDFSYRNMLARLTGKRSATELSDAEHATVLNHMVASGARLKWSARQARQYGDAKDPPLKKVRALLLSLGNYSDGYADALGKRMYKVDRFEWCDPKQLIGIVTALTKQLDKVRTK